MNKVKCNKQTKMICDDPTKLWDIKPEKDIYKYKAISDCHFVMNLVKHMVWLEAYRNGKYPELEKTIKKLTIAAENTFIIVKEIVKDEGK